MLYTYSWYSTFLQFVDTCQRVIRITSVTKKKLTHSNHMLARVNKMYKNCRSIVGLTLLIYSLRKTICYFARQIPWNDIDYEIAGEVWNCHSPKAQQGENVYLFQ